ncbi:uncharacterized protein LOC127832187 [Dreissena polymorpha]|uniref:Uncharacterized protein n=1 Tax=Dreissena polymorpha TaxID=45954 RepID=A0A9D4GVJ6_DREPO|nr:uncharacterized protein LOC127832187 [Dreissena polymorpha]KAH3822360.1 hypothetical protein DPMN_124138 [Dreissena polymorpha]
MPVYHKSSHPVAAVTCSVCREDAANPKQLACDHSFCQQCLRHQVAKLSDLLDRQERVTIVCPYCRDYILSTASFLGKYSNAVGRRSIRRSKTSLGHVSVSEYGANYSADRKAERCQPCAEGSIYELAVFWCMNCSEYMCAVCAKYHQAMRMSKDHVVKTTRDKERYAGIKSKVMSTRPVSAREPKPTHAQVSKCKEGSHIYCEPCSLGKKTKDANYFCDNCKEQMCEECGRCHRNMKMAKAHKMLPISDVVSKAETTYSLAVKCDRHYGETLSLYCKRCKTSCCAVCAITVHGGCGKAREKSGDPPKELVEKKKATDDTTKEQTRSFNALEKAAHDLSNGKTVSFSIKPNAAAQSAKSYPKKKMELRKRRLQLDSNNAKDWVISITLLTSGDMILIQLYAPLLKMIAPDGTLISTCRFYGEPWSVAVYNDSLAVVSFSDRKQLQLIHISRAGLESGKKFSTRHKCLAVCFAKNMIAATCWEGCVHVMDVTGNELASADTNHRGDRLFTNPEYIASDKNGHVLYVSDFKRNAVTALTLLPSKINNRPAFVFSHKELQGPKGVSVDRDGFIYVSGMTSRNIFRLASSGDLVQIFRRREDTEFYEALVVSPSADKLFVTAYEDNAVLEFKLKDA